MAEALAEVGVGGGEEVAGVPEEKHRERLDAGSTDAEYKSFIQDAFKSEDNENVDRKHVNENIKSVRESLFRRTNFYKGGKKILDTYNEQGSALLSIATLFLSGIMSFGVAFRSTRNCKSDLGPTIILFCIFSILVCLNLYMNIGKTADGHHLKLLLMLLLVSVEGVVFFSGRLFVECSQNPEKENDLKSLFMFSELFLLMSLVFVFKTVFRIDYSITLFLSLFCLQLLIMISTGVYPFPNGFKQFVGNECDVSKCMKEGCKVPEQKKEWMKYMMRSHDKNGMSCSRRVDANAGKAILSSLFGDDGLPHDYFMPPSPPPKAAKKEKKKDLEKSEESEDSEEDE